MYDNIIVLGVIVSLIFIEVTGWSPAGIIVPGYIALNLKTPQRIVYTLAIALLTYGLVRLLERLFIIYGRRLFALSVVLAFLLGRLLGWINGSLSTPLALPSLIGALVPGVMASEFRKQGALRSLCALLAAVSAVALVMFICGEAVF